MSDKVFTVLSRLRPRMFTAVVITESVPEEKIIYTKQPMELVDVDGNGTIDYTEFISATMHKYRLDINEHLYKSFQYFNKGNSGHIAMDELETGITLRKHGSKTCLKSRRRRY